MSTAVSSSSSSPITAAASPISLLPSRQMKIYTRTGDRGTSALFTGERRPKTDPIFDALGCLDELSAQLGVALADLPRQASSTEEQQSSSSSAAHRELADRLIRVQCLLQECMSCVATPRGTSSVRKFHLERSAFPIERAKELEAWIDEYTAQLPPLKQFILPSGSHVACQLHVARAVCRRAERSLACLLDTSGSGDTSGHASGVASGDTSGHASGVASGDTSGHASNSTTGYLEPAAYAYVNRLSDFLFTAARFVSKLDGIPETVHRPVR